MSVLRELVGVAFPWRLLATFFTTLALALVLIVIYPRAPQNGLWWDALMVTGLVGAAFLIVAPIISPRVWVHFGGSTQALRFIVTLHTDIAYAALLLSVVHVVGLYLIDATMIEYLKLSAPWSMLAGLVAALLLVVLTVTSLYRRELRWRYRSWRAWHIGLSTAALALTAFHIFDAGYYINTPTKKIALMALLGGPILVPYCATAWRGTSSSTIPVLDEPITTALPNSRAFSARLIALTVILSIVAVAFIIIPQPHSRAENQARSCPLGVCD